MQLLLAFKGLAQHNVEINAKLDASEKELFISQTIEYKNASKDSLSEIKLMDWANAFSSKETPLAVRFNEDYRRAFHFSSEKERGKTYNLTISDTTSNNLSWNREPKHPDVVSIDLKKKLLPGQSFKIKLNYTVKIPNERFTSYGYDDKSFKLRYWYLTPALYNNDWVIFSHKNLNDFTAALCSISLNIDIPKTYTAESSLVEIEKKSDDKTNTYSFKGNYTSLAKLYVLKENKFYNLTHNNKVITSDILKKDLSKEEYEHSIKKVYDFISEYFGELPQEKMLLSYSDYLKQPVYGLTQLPEKLRPFQPEFSYEMILVKQMSKQFCEQSFVSNLRTEQWFTDAIQVYVMINYVKKYYPESKLVGRLSKIFGLRWFHAADLSFNDQYYLGAKNMSARFLQQPLSMPKDSLLKFNYNISNPYKAGMGLNYLDSYLATSVKEVLKTFFENQQLKITNATDFTDILKNSTSKNIDWFTDDFINNNTIIDAKITGVTRKNDSIYVNIKNNGKKIPVTVSAIKKKKIVGQVWSDSFKDSTAVAFPKKYAKQFIIDYYGELPEANRRNNYHKTSGILTKKLQFRLLQDIEDPEYYQTFLVPVYDFNVYDGLLIGANFFNKSLIRRNFTYGITPTYGLESKKLVGSFGINYSHQIKDYGWYLFSGGISGNTSSYAENLLFKSFTPSVNLRFRPKDLRRNLGQIVSLSLTSIQRELDPEIELPTPNYDVFRARYGYTDPNLTHSVGFGIEFEQAKNFNKISGTFKYSKIFLNNQRVSVRVFAGTFFNNKTQQDGDFFSFALDRPTDYLFKYNYLGRAEDSGITSQQLITAEGNFKSKLNPRFANEWLTTSTFESSIWQWIEGYADIGLVKNKGFDTEFLYDSGIKLNLVNNYFELYFPLQSSLGFEPSLGEYEKRIRFKVSLSLNTLIGLFTREWY